MFIEKDSKEQFDPLGVVPIIIDCFYKLVNPSDSVLQLYSMSK